MASETSETANEIIGRALGADRGEITDLDVIHVLVDLRRKKAKGTLGRDLTALYDELASHGMI